MRWITKRETGGVLQPGYRCTKTGDNLGYYPEPTKSILVMPQGNVARVEEHFRGLRIRVVKGHRYLGGIHRRRRGGKELAEVKDSRLDGVREYPCRGFPKAPSVCLRRTTKVPPTGVGFCARVPAHRINIQRPQWQDGAGLNLFR